MSEEVVEQVQVVQEVVEEQVEMTPMDTSQMPMMDPNMQMQQQQMMMAPNPQQVQPMMAPMQPTGPQMMGPKTDEDAFKAMEPINATCTHCGYHGQTIYEKNMSSRQICWIISLLLCAAPLAIVPLCCCPSFYDREQKCSNCATVLFHHDGVMTEKECPGCMELCGMCCKCLADNAPSLDDVVAVGGAVAREKINEGIEDGSIKVTVNGQEVEEI